MWQESVGVPGARKRIKSGKICNCEEIGARKYYV
jgi:hypothetical protein